MNSSRFDRAVIAGVARIAARIEEPGEFSPEYLAPHIVEAVRIVGLRLRPSGDKIVCPLCSRGPFTKRGYYLHLIRVHPREILLLVREESERVARGSRL